MEYAEKCFNKAEKVEAIDVMVISASQVCVTLFLAGDYVKLVDISRRALQRIEEHHREKDFFDGYNLYSNISAWCGFSLGWLGNVEEGKALLNKALQNAGEVNDLFAMGLVGTLYTYLLYFEGDGDNTLYHAQQSIKYSEEAGADTNLGNGWMMLGAGYYLLGEYETAREHADKGLKIQKSPVMLPWHYYTLAVISVALGNLEQAQGYFAESLKLSQEFNVKDCEGVARILLGVLAGKADLEHIDDALKQIQQGISILEEGKLKLLIALGHLHLGELFVDAGRKEEALKNLKKAETLYQEMKVTPKSSWLKRTKKALGKLG